MKREEAILEARMLETYSLDSAISLVDKIYDSIEKSMPKDTWKWVETEYCALFERKNALKGGRDTESCARLKYYYKKYPEITKEDVLGATKLYLSHTDSRYIMFPHYFLKKGRGTSATYEFDTWYKRYLTMKEAEIGRTASSNTMQ